MTERKKMLAAIVYEAGSGSEADQILTRTADTLSSRGLRVAGTVQRAFERADRCACDMIVRDLASGNEVKISEDRGPDARGCRLDPRMLEALVGSTAAALEAGVDVLVLNKFGKQEANGAGFRAVIGQALAEEVPTLIGVNAAYLDAWRAFADGFADELAPDEAAVRAWLGGRVPIHSAPDEHRQPRNLATPHG